MKKKVLISTLFVAVTLVMGCGIVTEQDLDAEAIEQGKKMEETLDTIDDQYIEYVENMGIDVNAALEE